jgi:hypothetical protein
VAAGGTGTTSPSLVAGTNITSITGTWPNQTINAATQGTTTAALTFNNSNTGAASGTSFNGGTSQAISTNTLNAANLGTSNSFAGALTVTVNAHTNLTVTSQSTASNFFENTFVVQSPNEGNGSFIDGFFGLTTASLLGAELGYVKLATNPYILLQAGGTFIDTATLPLVLAGTQVGVQGSAYFGNSNIGTTTLPSGCTGLSIGTANQWCAGLTGSTIQTGTESAAAFTDTSVLSATVVGTNSTGLIVPVTSLPYSFLTGAPVAPLSNAITSATGGTGTGTVTCLTVPCTNLRGSYSVAGGTFTTGTFLTLVWPATPTAYVCTVVQNGLSPLGFGHTVATTTGMAITTTATIAAITVTVDYSCAP